MHVRGRGEQTRRSGVRQPQPGGNCLNWVLGHIVFVHQTPLLTGLSRLTAERLAEKAPFSPGNDPHETVGSLVAKLTFHEAYHVGQTALLRRLAGHPGAIA